MAGAHRVSHLKPLQRFRALTSSSPSELPRERLFAFPNNNYDVKSNKPLSEHVPDVLAVLR